MKVNQVKVKILRKGNALEFDIPAYMTPSSSGVDLRAAEENVSSPAVGLSWGQGLP